MAKAQQEARQERGGALTSCAAPAVDADQGGVRAIRRLPLIESVADERLAGLAMGTDGGAGEDQVIEMRKIALDVGAEVRYNGHVVEPDAKDRAAKQSLCLG